MVSRSKMSAEEVAGYLDARDEWCVLTTIDENGYPHSVALGYYRVRDDLCVGTPANTHKVANLERNPRASLLVAKSKASGDWSGVLLQGDIEIVRDDEARLRIEHEGLRQRGTPDAELPAEPRRGEVILRLAPQRTVTWRYV